MRILLLLFSVNFATISDCVEVSWTTCYTEIGSTHNFSQLDAIRQRSQQVIKICAARVSLLSGRAAASQKLSQFVQARGRCSCLREVCVEIPMLRTRTRQLVPLQCVPTRTR